MTKQYAQRVIMALEEAGNYYSKHMASMTGEKLHDKSDIAAELAYRDFEIDKLKSRIGDLEQDLRDRIMEEMIGQNCR